MVLYKCASASGTLIAVSSPGRCCSTVHASFLPTAGRLHLWNTPGKKNNNSWGNSVPCSIELELLWKWQRLLELPFNEEVCNHASYGNSCLLMRKSQSSLTLFPSKSASLFRGCLENALRHPQIAPGKDSMTVHGKMRQRRFEDIQRLTHITRNSRTTSITTAMWFNYITTIHIHGTQLLAHKPLPI